METPLVAGPSEDGHCGGWTNSESGVPIVIWAHRIAATYLFGLRHSGFIRH
jgi:hypothetical protein